MKQNLIEMAERPYREAPTYGVQFSIDAEAYECRLGDRVSFGDNTTSMECGVEHNYQPILVDGKDTGGYLHEWRRGGLFTPTCISFCYPIADCTEEHLVTDEHRRNPHFFDEGETYLMAFATLDQYLDYLKLET